MKDKVYQKHLTWRKVIISMGTALPQPTHVIRLFSYFPSFSSFNFSGKSLKVSWGFFSPEKKLFRVGAMWNQKATKRRKRKHYAIVIICHKNHCHAPKLVSIKTIGISANAIGTICHYSLCHSNYLP